MADARFGELMHHVWISGQKRTGRLGLLLVLYYQQGIPCIFPYYQGKSDLPRAGIIDAEEAQHSPSVGLL
jgi:hypothetical protein